LQCLEITVFREDWEREIEDIQWGEVLRPFASVKEMTLARGNSVRLVAPALRKVAGERATEVLPALQNLFLKMYGWQPSGPVKEDFEQFIATRQLNGHPITVHY